MLNNEWLPPAARPTIDTSSNALIFLGSIVIAVVMMRLMMMMMMMMTMILVLISTRTRNLYVSFYIHTYLGKSLPIDLC